MNQAFSKASCNIELNDVRYCIAGESILQGLSFTADQQRIGIVGRNGSGKSTLARLLCGLINPSSGTIRVAGIDVAHDRHQAIRTVGMLFQNPDHQIIFPTVEEELGFGLQQLGMSRENAREHTHDALCKFGIEDWAGKSVSALSQGQRHLVCLLAVMLMKPRLIVLDEPYAGLDIPTTMQLTRHLDNVEAVVIHVSHQTDALLNYERILWLEAGEIVNDGTPESVLPAFTERMKELGCSSALL